MYTMGKGFHPINFTFASQRTGKRLRIGKQSFVLSVVGTSDDVYRVRIENRKLWPRDCSMAALAPLKGASEKCRGAGSRLEITRHMEIRLRDKSGTPVLVSKPGEAFGVSGPAWVFQFVQPPAAQFYGMGEKSTPFEKSGRAHKFWNTDAYGDFTGHQVAYGDYDPDYISVPWVIVKQGNTYTGLLVDSPFASMIGAGTRGTPGQTLWLGAEHGPASLYLIHGPSLPELVRKFQRLTGLAPLPPLWALGYHQCRWGYRSRTDLAQLAAEFEKYGFPADGLWLDIDYMRGYRVFTFDRKNFASPRTDLKSITKRGYRVVPIIDPGVKHEPGYSVYDSGRAADVFCRNPAGGEFIGHVWPGNTAFPDFTMPKARKWWAEHVRMFAELGVGGAWLDMNDPSTGHIECVGMLFRNGTAPHDAYHSQYAMQMARATREGFLAARPNERPFLISRSGFTGAQKYSGHWTGDNVSSYRHLHRAIGRSLNLAMSGIAFNAPDIGGFMGDTTAQLLCDWMKACFLFPFCRNHTCAGTRRQEPWAFDRTTLDTMRHYARVRYKLIPYLYNLFVAHCETGEAVLRPLFHDCADSKKLNLGAVDDQFLVGPWIMQAPFVVERDATRDVVLPSGMWYELHTGRWCAGNRCVCVNRDRMATPVYLRDGAVVPMQRGTPRTNRKDLASIELLVALSGTNRTPTELEYVFDDGLSFGYRKGVRSRYRVCARRRGAALEIALTTCSERFGRLDVVPVTVDTYRRVVLSVDGVARELKGSALHTGLVGTSIPMWQWK